METTRLALYERLPEIHRVRDADQEPPYPLRAWVGLVEGVLGEVHRDIGRLYRDLFIETCADWVVPYIGDLLGAGHLSGDPWTLRADVAQTIALRRRKGTLAGIERATYALTRWAVHCVELRERLAWCQHLNHQRPDAGGEPPYARADRFTPVRGGTAAIRDPAMLSLTGTPFDPWARVADLRPPAGGAARPNLPNLAVFLWRLEAYRVRMATPAWRGTASYAPSAPASGDATRAVRFDLNPLSPPGAGVPPAPLYPVRLFNAWNFDPRLDPPVVTALDHVPGPMLRARLDDDSPAGNPRAYVAIEPFDPGAAPPPAGEVSDAGVQLHLPQATFAGRAYPEGPGEPRHWRIRGANLCAWETTVRPPLRADEVLVDPELG